MKIRNKNENQPFIEYLESAISEAEQAIDSITYTSFPEINNRTIAQLKKAIDIMVNVKSTCIFKP